MKSLKAIRAQARSARDDRYYDKLYALVRWFSGDDELMLSGVSETPTGSQYGYHSGSDCDLPEYPYIELPLGLPGVQNHGLINSRINIQSIVYAEPELVFAIDNPIIRKVNEQFIKKRWEQGDWSSIFLEVGMEVEATGIGLVEIGIREGRVTIETRSVLDTLWDRGHRSRGGWRFVFFRNRLDIDEALEKYDGLVTEEELEHLARDVRFTASWLDTGLSGQGELKQVREWSYWSPTCHAVFLGSIGDVGQQIVLRLVEDEDNFVYERIGTDDEEIVGPNPFGVIPCAVWTDCWSPGVLRPVGKTETTWRSARILNQLEAHMVTSCERDIPITIISTANMSQDQIARLARAQGPKDIGLIIPIDAGDVGRSVLKVGAGGIGTGVLQAIQYYKEQINAATGVADTQRGQPLPGDKTAEEVRTLSASQGIQNKHLRRQFSSFLKDVINKARLIASKFDRDPCILQLGSNTLNTADVDISPMLAMPIDVMVREDSLSYKSEQDKRLERLQEFQAVDMPAMQAGVADPVKVFRDVYQDLGVLDPETRMYSQEQMQKMATMVSSAQQGASSAPKEETSGATYDGD